VQVKPEEFTEQKALELKNPEIRNGETEIIPDDFDWKEYTSVHKDLRGIKTEMDACLPGMVTRKTGIIQVLLEVSLCLRGGEKNR